MDPIAFIFSQWGLAGVGAFLLLVFVIKNWSWIMDKIKDVNSSRMSHDSFGMLMAKLDYWLDFKIQNMYINDPGRRQIFRDLMHIRYKVFKEHLERLNKNDFNAMEPGAMYSKIVACLHDSIEESEMKAHEAGIPDVVVQKFKKWSGKNVEFTLKAIEMVCYSQVYGSNVLRMQAVYSLYTAMFEITIAEGERSLNELNGELNGVEYKGYVCCG